MIRGWLIESTRLDSEPYPALATTLGIKTFFEEPLSEKFFQMPSEASAMDDLMSLTFMKRIVPSPKVQDHVGLASGILSMVGR